MAQPVLYKADFVRRYAAGEFGNHSPTWDSIAEFVAAGRHCDSRLYHLRNRVAGATTWYNLTGLSVPYYWNRAVQLGHRPSRLYISEMAPTAATLLQGEVQRGIWGLDLYYTTVRKPMRDALREWARQARGIIALAILQRFLDPSSYAWLEHLLDTYPGHAIEFSTYDCCWGTVSGRNTVWWEVRRY